MLHELLLMGIEKTQNAVCASSQRRRKSTIVAGVRLDGVKYSFPHSALVTMHNPTILHASARCISLQGNLSVLEYTKHPTG